MPNPNRSDESPLDFPITPRDVVSAVLGGLVVFGVQRLLARLKNQDDQKSELRKELKEFVRTIEDKSHEYWSRGTNVGAPGGDLESRDINRRIERAMATADILAAAYPKRRTDLQMKFITFKQAVTGGSFQSADRAAEPDRCLLVTELANDLCSCVTSLGVGRPAPR